MRGVAAKARNGADARRRTLAVRCAGAPVVVSMMERARGRSCVVMAAERAAEARAEGIAFFGERGRDGVKRGGEVAGKGFLGGGGGEGVNRGGEVGGCGMGLCA